MKGIGSLKNLSKLICRENRLKQCWEVAGLGLEELDLQKNRISDDLLMQKTIVTLRNIQKLNYLDNCFLEENNLKEVIIDSCKSLKILNEQDVNSPMMPTESSFN